MQIFPTVEKLPEKIVIDGSYFWKELSTPIMSFTLCDEDCNTIIYDIIVRFLTMNDPEVADFEVEIPDFNRMREVSIRDNPTKLQELIHAVRVIEETLHQTFSRLDIFTEGHQFSYMFDRFLGHDIVICKLPY